ncbi:FeoA family protein [Wandonia haliotis]|uniref:FeoA family protein n=1 Tax=Wandonia haliotis TaxID=574963 RepID=A0ABN1MPA6_9FLAO
MKTVLSDLRKGDKAVITEITEGTSTLRLMELGLIPGAELRVVAVSPFGDPIAISLDDYSLSLRLHDAKQVVIERK